MIHLEKRPYSLTVVLPAHNEAMVIGDIIREIHRLHPDAEILVVNDGSTDKTAEVAADAGAVVWSHPYNMGNGAAVKTGIRNAKGDILVFMDADGQHLPEDISRLLEYFPKFDMVVGKRERDGQASMGRAIGNSFYNWMASYVTRFRVEDLTSGFRAIKAEVAREYLYLLPNTYSYPTTITLGVLRDGRSVRYVPINIQKRKSGKSGIKILGDGTRFLVIIIKICTLYSPLRVFLPVSLTMFVFGLSWYLYSFFSKGRFTNMGALLFTSSVIIFMMGLVSEQICQMRAERRSASNLVQNSRPSHNRESDSH